MARKKSSSDLDVSTLAAMHLTKLAEGKAAYKIADDAMKVLRAKAKVGEVITLPRRWKSKPELAGKKFKLRHKGDTFNVGQLARCHELKEVTSL